MFRSFLERLKRKTIKDILWGIAIRLFYIYPLRTISPLVNLSLLLILFVLSPFCKVKIGLLFTQRIGHLAVNTDLFLRRRQLVQDDHVFYIFFAGKPCNRQLLDMWKRHLYIIENQLLYDLIFYSISLLEKSSYYNPLKLLANEYNEYQQTKPIISFSPWERELGCKELKKMGIDLKKDWYVCIYARDSKYLNETYPKGIWGYHDYRNADIDRFRAASEYIVGKGGYVVRIGSHVNKPFDMQNERIIDYASNHRSDFMDIFIVANCRFVVGSPSGICDLSMLFDVPYLGINCVPIGSVPHGKGGLFIPKKIKERETGEHVSFSPIIRETRIRNSMFWNGNWWHQKGYELIENTEEEILEVVREMTERLERRFILTDEERELLETYFRMYPEDHWAKSVRTPIGMTFLKENQQLFFN